MWYWSGIVVSVKKLSVYYFVLRSWGRGIFTRARDGVSDQRRVHFVLSFSVDCFCSVRMLVLSEYAGDTVVGNWIANLIVERRQYLCFSRQFPIVLSKKVL